MARYMIEVETEEAGAEERIATLKGLVSSAFRMKVVSARLVDDDPAMEAALSVPPAFGIQESNTPAV